MENKPTLFGLTECELSDLIQHDNNLVVYDLRKNEEFAKGHIKKSIIAQYTEGNLLNVPKSSKIVLISKDGEQSKKMANALHSSGFDAMYLIGGIENWPNGLYYTNISYVGTG